MLKRLIGPLACLIFPLLASAGAFSLTDTQGRMHTLQSHQGKWVLVNLWATWCAPCLVEMPELEALSKSRDDLVVLGLAVDGQSARRIMQFADKLRITYPVIAGNAEMARPFGPKGYPTSILYDASGGQALFKEGPITRQQIEDVLERRNTDAVPQTGR